MKILVIDGNSILNRAFYGIKLLTTKDGKFTNGIYGFLNILFSLEHEYTPDAVAIAFDLKAPTFRHKMYALYKGNRKGMPDELAEQMPVLKELLGAMGYRLVECEGWEADDILGTIADKCPKDDMCYIATGDRDSLQLVTDNVHVVLASSRMGKTQYIEYDPAKIKEEKGVEPKKLIEVKALMGDSSDNIPGVSGVGEKGATDLISKFGDIDYIYDNLNTIKITDGMRKKLERDRDNAFMSRTLGTISVEVPVDTDINDYIPSDMNKTKVKSMLTSLEMFKFIDRLGLNDVETVFETDREVLKYEFIPENPDDLIDNIKSSGEFYFIADYNYETALVKFENKIFRVGFNLILDILSDNNIKKYTHDLKTLSAHLLKNGYDINNVVFDTLLAGYLLNPNAKDYAVHTLSDNYAVSAEIENSDDDSVKTFALFCSLCAVLNGKIEENGQTMLLRDVEIPLSVVLSSMELYGFAVDKEGIVEFGLMLEKRIDALVREIYDYSGCAFNLNSPKQLGEVLFETMNLPAKKKTKTGYSTSAEVLEGLIDVHPIIPDILEYRTLSKLKSTYCDGLLKVIASDGRIHSTFTQTETRTGRLSSTEPNLQNIPVRSELGREMRKFFRAEDGFVLCDADYSQIELRVLADIADDKNMIEAFNNGDDIHAITASQVFKMPMDMVTPLMRSRAKAVNFGIVYGIGAFSLAKDIGVTRAKAAEYIKSYLSHYSGVDNYMYNIIADAKEKGYVTTLFGRRRYLPELNMSNAVQRAFGERVARNMPIQGTAADIIKIAMVRVYDRLKRENMRSRLIMQVHDELIIEAPEDERVKALNVLKEEMENAVKMKVTLSVDAHAGKTWYEAKG